MTGLLHEKEFSRQTFLKGGGALVVGLSLGAGAAASTAAAAAPTSAGFNPPLTSLDTWITITADNKVILKTSQIEVGNGITTGFLQVLAEELDTDMSQMRYGNFNNNTAPVIDTWVVGQTGGEGGSNAMSGTGPKVRTAGILAKQALLGMASTQLGVPVANLTVKSGVVSGGGRTVTYGQLMGGKLFNLTGTNVNTLPGGATPGGVQGKTFAQYNTVGHDKRNLIQRIEIPAKVDGSYSYVHNVRVPNMLHGRVIRPHGQGAYPYNSNVAISVDPTSISHIPNATVVQVGNFIGVVAPKEYDAIQAAAQLKVVWNTNPILPTSANLWKHYRDLDKGGLIVAKASTTRGDVDGTIASAAANGLKVVSGTFAHHYNGHTPIGPGCVVADVRSDHATIWSSTQNVTSLASDLENVLAPLTRDKIRILFFEGSSSYGNGWHAFDVAEAASILSRATGKPVRLQFMRWDEQGWTHYAPASLIDIRGAVDSNGYIQAYDSVQFVQGGSSIYTSRELLGAGPGSPSASANTIPTSVSGGNHNTENASPWMVIPHFRLTSKPISSAQGMFHSGAMRAPGAQQMTVADAQIIDMMAVAAGMDSLAFRLQNMNKTPSGGTPAGQTTQANTSASEQGVRWSDTLKAAATGLSWTARVSGSALQSGDVVTGRGIANSHHGGSYAAVAVEVQVNKKTGKLVVTKLSAAQDNGFTTNPNLVENQMLGSSIQGVSRAMGEEIQFNKNNVTSADWVTYPILRFKDSPEFIATIVPRDDQPSLGSGEPPTCPVVGAIANAFHDATGARLHEQPFTPARVRATLKAYAAGQVPRPGGA